MERKLHLLDSFSAQGSDGQTYKVMAYEHMVRDETLLPGGQAPWEATGVSEFRLADGERVEMAKDGSMRVVKSGVELRVANSQSSSA